MNKTAIETIDFRTSSVRVTSFLTVSTEDVDLMRVAPRDIPCFSQKQPGCLANHSTRTDIDRQKIRNKFPPNKNHHSVESMRLRSTTEIPHRERCSSQNTVADFSSRMELTPTKNTAQPTQ